MLCYVIKIVVSVTVRTVGLPEAFCVWVCPSVSLYVRATENFVDNVSQESMKGISPNFNYSCIWVHRCADYRLWGQKVKGCGHSRRRHNRQRQPVEFHQAKIIIKLNISKT